MSTIQALKEVNHQIDQRIAALANAARIEMEPWQRDQLNQRANGHREAWEIVNQAILRLERESSNE